MTAILFKVDDVQLLLNDGHLLPNPHETSIWIGVYYNTDTAGYKWVLYLKK